jgi:hypothetical protein
VSNQLCFRGRIIDLVWFFYRYNTNWPRNTDGLNGVDSVWNVMARSQKPDFVFRRNGRVHLNRRGRQFSRLLAAEVWASAIVMLDTPCSEIVWRVLATHFIRQFPLYYPPVRQRVPSHFNWTLQHDSYSNWVKHMSMNVIQLRLEYSAYVGLEIRVSNK